MVRALTFCILLQASPLWAQLRPEQKQSPHFMFYIEKGDQLFNEQNYADALMYYNEGLHRYPYYAEAYYARAVTKEKLNDPQGALVDYTIFLEMKPDHYDARFSKAMLLFEQENWNLAKADFKQLIRLPAGPTSSVYYRQDRHTHDIDHIFTNQGTGKSHLYNMVGLIELALGDHQNALTYFDSAIYLDPNQADYFVNIGQCNEAMGKVQDAIAAYQNALHLNPNHGMAMHNLSVLNRQLGASEKAIALLNEAIAKNPDLPYPYAERAYEAMEKGEFYKALNDFNQAIRLAPTDADYWLGRGILNGKLHRYEAAYNDLSQAVKLDDSLLKAWVNRANLLFQWGKYSQAIEDYSVAIYLDDQYAIAYYNRALALQKMGKNKEACEGFKTAHALGQPVKPKLFEQVCVMQ